MFGCSGTPRAAEDPCHVCQIMTLERPCFDIYWTVKLQLLETCSLNMRISIAFKTGLSLFYLWALDD